MLKNIPSLSICDIILAVPASPKINLVARSSVSVILLIVSPAKTRTLWHCPDAISAEAKYNPCT